jgi:hypothetical protein
MKDRGYKKEIISGYHISSPYAKNVSPPEIIAIKSHIIPAYMPVRPVKSIIALPAGVMDALFFMIFHYFLPLICFNASCSNLLAISSASS